MGALVATVWTASVVGVGIITFAGVSVVLEGGFNFEYFFVTAVCGGNDDISSILGGVVKPLGLKLK